MKLITLAVLTAICFTAQAADFPGAIAMDAVLTAAVQDGQIPGAVVIVGHKGQVVYHHAYGFRALVPQKELMTEDTIFDAASLTKVVATTSCIMKLVETGKLRINDRVTEYLPQFQGGHSTITIRNLLTHFSGLRPDLDLKPEWSGYETGIQKALVDHPANPPGTRFVYSDINYILLGEIVRKLSGQSLPDFARQNVFVPLGMKDSMFQPPASLRPRIAPTEILEGTNLPLRGVVHDQTTRFMGGVAGHAGLFTTAADLARFAQMMLGVGQLDGTRVFSPLTIRKFTSAQTPAEQPILRGFGWDIDSPFSGNRGDLYPIGSFGHTGFTGTSMWIDPATDSYVILMTNSVHPHRTAPITALRGRVASVAAAGIQADVPPGVSLAERPTTPPTDGGTGNVLTGLQLWWGEGFRAPKEKQIGLYTNQT